MGYCPFCIVTEWLGSWAGRWARRWALRARAGGRAGRASRRRGAGLGVRRALGWSAWGARQGRVAGVARGRDAQAGALACAGVGAQAGGQQAGAQGVGRARVLCERGQAGCRRAAAGARTRQGCAGRARSLRGRAGWAAGAWPGRWARPGCEGWP